MILKEITLRNWRNYRETTVSPSPGLNLIVGQNGAGKTNLAEAIYYLSLGRAWRGLSHEELIRQDAESAHLVATIEESGLPRKIEINLTKKGRSIFVNGKGVRKLSDLSKVSNVIAFSPENVRIFSGPPAERRSFLDLAIAKEDPGHLTDLNAFLKILQERNAVLKDEFRNDGYLSVLTSELIAIERPISERRKRYLERLLAAFKECASSIFGEGREVSILFHPFLESDGYEEKAKALYAESLAADIARGSTSKGAHKEDFTVMLDGKDVGAYGSQGENRILSLALHLTPFFLVEDEGKKPIVVLDDVYSELDDNHAQNLTALLQRMGQVFVTATKTNLENASVIEVQNDKATIRREQYGRKE